MKKFIICLIFVGIVVFLLKAELVIRSQAASQYGKDGRTLTSFAIQAGQITCSTPGTAYPVPIEAESLSIRALAGNAGNIYVNDSTVSSTNGYELSAKESVDLGGQGFYIAPNTVYITCSSGGDKVSWIRLY